MPKGKGTYGKKRGRPPKKKKGKSRTIVKARRGKKPGTRRRMRGRYTG
jgi:hypothetical protein